LSKISAADGLTEGEGVVDKSSVGDGVTDVDGLVVLLGVGLVLGGAMLMNRAASTDTVPEPPG
jgi:hypothetical protein